MNVNFNCKDNDVRLRFVCKDEVIDEVFAKIRGEKCWLIIGYKDLLDGIKKAENKLSKVL